MTAQPPSPEYDADAPLRAQYRFLGNHGVPELFEMVKGGAVSAPVADFISRYSRKLQRRLCRQGAAAVQSFYRERAQAWDFDIGDRPDGHVEKPNLVRRFDRFTTDGEPWTGCTGEELEHELAELPQAIEALRALLGLVPAGKRGEPVCLVVPARELRRLAYKAQPNPHTEMRKALWP